MKDNNKKCICNLEIDTEVKLDGNCKWSYLALKRSRTGYYIVGYGDDISYYQAQFCPACGQKLN